MTGKHKGGWKPGASIAAAVLICLALGGCSGQMPKPADQPQAEEAANAQDASPTTAQAASQAASPTAASGTSGFDAGLLPDSRYNTDFINAGNRGCGSCHGDLGQFMEKSGLNHIKVEGEYGKQITVSDCLPCHRQHWIGSGPYYGDMLHERHYSNEEFDGNCWSCHAQDSAGAVGEYQWELWDEFKYTASLGGFPSSHFDEGVKGWLMRRGSSATGSMSNITLDSDPTLEVSLGQDVKDESDTFILNNYGTFEVDASQWELSITGVSNERTFTLDDLKTMPQHEMTATQVCFTSAINSPFASNIPMKGVLVSDLIDACGGLAEGTNTFAAAGADGWATSYPIPFMIDNNAIIALEYFGHELTADQGYPATLVVPGMPGSPWVKHLTMLGGLAQPEEAIVNSYALMSDGVTSHKTNSGWFDSDGVQGKAGSPLTLTGYGFSWSGTDLIAPLATLSISFDYGATWQDVAVPDDADPYQWVTFSANWTPKEPGVYVAWLKATNADGFEQESPAGLFIVVTE